MSRTRNPQAIEGFFTTKPLAVPHAGRTVPTAMLRAVLNVFFALVLIAQGGVGTLARHGGHMAKMPCHHLDQHGNPVKMPCCPDGCRSDDGCPACVLVFDAALLLPAPRVERLAFERVETGLTLVPIHPAPPT